MEMTKIGLYVVGALAVLNGFAMWFAPMTWFETVPGVSMMGPFNLHFVRDIALVYAFSGGAMIWGAATNVGAIAIAGATWPALHALFHVSIWMGRGFAFDEIALVNLLGIQVPAWAGLLLAWRLHKS